MQPDEASDRIDDDGVATGANATATETEVEGQARTPVGGESTGRADRPASTADLVGDGDLPIHPGRDEGGDPPCWLGLIDDQRDHQ